MNRKRGQLVPIHEGLAAYPTPISCAVEASAELRIALDGVGSI